MIAERQPRMTGHLATEQRTLDDALRLFASQSAHARAVIRRIDAVAPLPRGATMLDIGCAQAAFAITAAQMGYNAIGVDPWEGARAVAQVLAREKGVTITVKDGLAEALPLTNNSVDLAYANSVIEHVDDAAAVFREVYRVLKPGGVFWFLTASSMCPRQCEIRGFPVFGWYPDALKRRIMSWATEHRPHLVGHTTKPAYHWFTPWKAHRMLKAAGFSTVYDRWYLRRGDEGGRLYRAGLNVVRSSTVTKLIADVIIPTVSYAAIKAEA